MSYYDFRSKFTPYLIVATRDEGFGSADIIFKSDVSSDNRLYRQESNQGNEIVGFEEIDEDFFGIHLTFSDVDEVIGEAEIASVSVGQACLFCFVSIGQKTFAYLFSRNTKLCFDDCLGKLKELDHQEDVGAGIEFLLRTFDDEHAAIYLRHAISTNRNDKFPKFATYIFLSSTDRLTLYQTVDFFRFGEVSVGEDGRIVVTHRTTLGKPDAIAIEKALGKLFPSASITVELSPNNVEIEPSKKSKMRPRTSIAKAKNVKARKRKNSIHSDQMSLYGPGFTGSDIATLRRKLGYSRPELAELIGISADRIRRWETKKSTQSIDFNSLKLDHLVEISQERSSKEARWLIRGGKSRARNTKKLLRLFSSNTELLAILEISKSVLATRFVAANPYSMMLSENSRYLELQSLSEAIFGERDDETNEIKYFSFPSEYIKSTYFGEQKYLMLRSTNSDDLRVLIISDEYRSDKHLWKSWFVTAFGDGFEEESLENIKVWPYSSFADASEAFICSSISNEEGLKRWLD